MKHFNVIFNIYIYLCEFIQRQDMMKAAVLDTKALVVTSQENMLEKLRHSEGMLDDIQRGLNEYLEKKRLFFPRLEQSFRFHF